MAEAISKSMYTPSPSCLNCMQTAIKEPLPVDGWSNPPWVPAETVSLKQTHSGFITAQLENSVENHEAKHLRSPSMISNETLLDGAVRAVNWQKEQSITTSTAHFFHLLQKCIHKKDLLLGREVHFKVVKSGLESDSFLGSHLIRMFTVFEDLWEANEVFRKISEPSVFAWSAIISAHVKLGRNELAVELYFRMRTLALEPDGHVFVATLQACASIASLMQGMLVHDHIIETGLEAQIYVGNTLIDMYAKCGSLQDACIVFDRLPERDVVTWNAMIACYGQHGHDVPEALQLFAQMSRQGFQPNSVSFICCLNACSSTVAIEQGKETHTYIISYGFDSDVQVGIALIDMYVKCGSLSDARIVFDRLMHVGTCESMAMAYFQHGDDQEVLELFQKMQQKGMLPNMKTFICILRACSSLSDLEQGWKIHSHIIGSGFEYDTFVGNTLVDLYGKCGSLEDAQVVFDGLRNRDVVTWSALISGYSLLEYCEDAVRIFWKMQEEGLKPNEITFTCVLKACSSTAALEHGRWIHSLIIDSGFELDTFVGSALVDMYAKCGNLEDACVVVEKFPEQDVVTWSVLISGYAQHGYGQEALQCYGLMQREGLEPSPSTLVGVLKACSSVAALEQAKQIHKLIVHRGLESDVFIGSALIDMYAKCGSLKDACAVFSSLPNRDIVTWSTMMAGFSQHNDYKLAFQCFQDMQEGGLQPNDATFTCLLSACSHAGRLDEGCHHFKSMREDHGIAPALEHYYTLVELFGHGGHFDEAEDLIESVPFQSNIVGWMSLLASCGRHGNVHLGRRCFEHAVRIKPGYSSGYALMWNLYARAGMWNDAKSVEELRISANAWKKPAKAFIEVDNQVHSFIVADKTHPRSADIYTKLKSLIDEIRNEGYTPCIDLVPDSRSNKDKEDALCGHSEKLAIVFGLICTPKGTTIRLSKNLRVCADCHSAAKAISKVEMREIIITDAYQIHHFKDGACSCVNFW